MATRANPSTDAYERARKVVHGWLASLHPEIAKGIPEDDGGQLLDSLAWEIDAATDQAREDEWAAIGEWCLIQAEKLPTMPPDSHQHRNLEGQRHAFRLVAETMKRGARPVAWTPEDIEATKKLGDWCREQDRS